MEQICHQTPSGYPTKPKLDENLTPSFGASPVLIILSAPPRAQKKGNTYTLEAKQSSRATDSFIQASHRLLRSCRDHITTIIIIILTNLQYSTVQYNKPNSQHEPTITTRGSREGVDVRNGKGAGTGACVEEWQGRCCLW